MKVIQLSSVPDLDKSVCSSCDMWAILKIGAKFGHIFLCQYHLDELKKLLCEECE